MSLCDLLNPTIVCTFCEKRWCEDCAFENVLEECPKAKDDAGSHGLIFVETWEGHG